MVQRTEESPRLPPCTDLLVCRSCNPYFCAPFCGSPVHSGARGEPSTYAATALVPAWGRGWVGAKRWPVTGALCGSSGHMGALQAECVRMCLCAFGPSRNQFTPAPREAR